MRHAFEAVMGVEDAGTPMCPHSPSAFCDRAFLNCIGRVLKHPVLRCESICAGASCLALRVAEFARSYAGQTFEDGTEVGVA